MTTASQPKSSKSAACCLAAVVAVAFMQALVRPTLADDLVPAVALGRASASAGAEPVRPRQPPVNVPSPTLGGDQFWSDELIFREWRIQRNVYTGHCRLLDDGDYRRAWGTFEECRRKLDQQKAQLGLKPLPKRVVLTMHGIIRSRTIMNGLVDYLEAHDDRTVMNVAYASTRRTLDDHAAALALVIENLEGVEQIDFVAHSLGCLVLRRYLGEASVANPRWKVDPRLHRIVMLGPPNHAPRLAEIFKNNKIVGMVWGPCCKQLASDWRELEPLLATPQQEFGIIAGGRGDERGNNPFLDGDDDLVLTVEETRLAGAADFMVAKARHGQLVNDPQVRECIVRFLDHGYFVSEAARHRLSTAEPPSEPRAAAGGR